MKFNVEVEVDWLEDGSLDDTVKEQVIGGIASRLEAKFVNGVTQEASNRVNQKIDELVTGLFEGFVSRGVTITDRWGDVKEKNVSIESLMKKHFDAAMTEKVDVRNGQPTDYNGVTRMEYILSKRVLDAAAAMTKDIVAQVDARIATVLNDSIKSRLSASLLSKVDVDGITKEALKSLK